MKLSAQDPHYFQLESYIYAYIQCIPENQFSYLSTETHVVGAQKNRLNEMILLSTQIICNNLWIRKLFTILGS